MGRRASQTTVSPSGSVVRKINPGACLRHRSQRMALQRTSQRSYSHRIGLPAPQLTALPSRSAVLEMGSAGCVVRQMQRYSHSIAASASILGADVSPFSYLDSPPHIRDLPNRRCLRLPALMVTQRP